VEYRLAKLLEAAGWPQGGRGSWVGDPESLVLRHRVYAPLLEELIDACGPALTALRRGEAGSWIAASQGPERAGQGKCPAEAVARLWLMLTNVRSR
jgi:hypothetical protein